MASCDSSRSAYRAPAAHLARPSGLEPPHANEEESHDSGGVLGQITVSFRLAMAVEQTHTH